MSDRARSKTPKKAAGGDKAGAKPAKAAGKGAEPKKGGAKGGELDEGTINNLEGMISKWVSIPYGIIVVLIAGTSLNLADYFLKIKDLGFSPTDEWFVKWGVIFGYYGGVLVGPFVDLVGTTVAFPIAAIFSGGGFVGLAYFSEGGKTETFGTIVIVALVIFVSFSSAIAAITSISTIIINFSKNVGPMIAAVMMTYYFIAPWFDITVRKGYFDDVSLKTNMIAMGVIQFVVFLLAAIVMDENEQSPSLKKASSLTDRVGILIYAGIAGGFAAVIYSFVIVAEMYSVGVFFMALLVLINFIVLGFTIQLLLGRIKRSDTSNVAEDKHPEKRNVCQMIFDIRYISLLLGAFIVVGSGFTYYSEAPSVAVAIGHPELGVNVVKAYWASLVITTLGGGLIAAIFNRLINGWVFAAVAALSSAAGFGFVFLADGYGEFWFYLSAFFVGGGVGGWWVIVPQLILDDQGPRNFESLWGISLTVIAAGWFSFEQLFDFISEKTTPSEPAKCTGVGCFMAPYIVSGVLCLIAVGLAFLALSRDSGSGGSADEKKPLKNNDANKGRKTDAGGAKGKSAGGREKSAGKAKSAEKRPDSKTKA